MVRRKTKVVIVKVVSWINPIFSDMDLYMCHENNGMCIQIMTYERKSLDNLDVAFFDSQVSKGVLGFCKSFTHHLPAICLRIEQFDWISTTWSSAAKNSKSIFAINSDNTGSMIAPLEVHSRTMTSTASCDVQDFSNIQISHIVTITSTNHHFVSVGNKFTWMAISSYDQCGG